MRKVFLALVVCIILIMSIMLVAGSVSAGPVRPSPTLTPPAPSPTPVSGMTTVCIWKDNKNCAFTPTYDDGLYNSLVIIDPIHAKYGIKGTAFINTANFDTNFPDKWPDIVAMVQRGTFAVGSHTVTHCHLTKQTAAEMDAEFENSNIDIYNHTGLKAEAIADPYNETNAAVKVEEAKYYVAARQGNFNATYPVYPTTTDYYGLYAHVFSNQTLAILQGYIDYAIQYGTWEIENFHGCTGGSESIDPALLDSFLAYAASKSNQVWNSDLASVAKYLRERQTSTITIQSNTASQIILALTDTLVNTSWFTYNQPLTLKTCVPSNWTSATIIQGTTQVTKPVVNEGGYKFIYYDALPNQGLVTINGI